MAEPRRGRVNLEKQMREIERLRAEMGAKSPQERVITTRAVARIVEDVHLEGRMGKFIQHADEPIDPFRAAVRMAGVHVSIGLHDVLALRPSCAR